MVHQLSNKTDYESFIKDNDQYLVVICFSAKWNGPCLSFGPKFVKISEEYETVKFATIDVEGNDKLVSKEGVGLLPAFCFYKSGKKLGNTVRGDEDKIRNHIDSLRLKP